jgi:uncharacterized protein YggU (UPF0235/DUF167 family)
MRLNVKVIPNSKSNRLVQEEGRSRVYLTMPINDPHPNKALIKFLAAHFYVKKNMISIISGEDKREKLVQVIKG